MHFFYDPDEWTYECKTGGEGLTRWVSCGQVRRPPEEVARIKAEKRRAYEDAILAQAERIKASRNGAIGIGTALS